MPGRKTWKPIPKDSRVKTDDRPCERAGGSPKKQKTPGLIWSTRPGSNWNSLRRLRRLIRSARSSLADRPQVGMRGARGSLDGIGLVISGYKKSPSPFVGRAFLVWSTRPGSNRRPPRWQRGEAPRSNGYLRLPPCRERHRAALDCSEYGPTALYGPSLTTPRGVPPRSRAPGLIISNP